MADTYTSAWYSSLKHIDSDKFLDKLVKGYTQIYLNLGIDRMAESIIQQLQKYEADGLIMHSNRSCKPYSLGQYYIQKMVRDRLSIPTLIIEPEMVDERNFSPSRIQTRIDAFMEILREQ